ncbi:MAG: tetratricopeptide repeat protein [candidate division Zixibacteria bacterium]|nr:tetratricopeptide repeat protein [candidate division Zixibacteria bacterium]
MQGKVKLSRREIKEDKFATFMLTSRQRAEANWQYIVIGVVAAAILIAGLIFYMNSRSNASQEASTKLSQAVIDYQSGNRQIAVLSLTQITDQYPDHPAAEQATYLLATINFESRVYPEATRFFEQYLSKYKNNKLNRAAALAGLAAIMENQGQVAEAGAKYLEAVKEYPDGPLEPDYYLSAVRTFLEAGNTTNAQMAIDSLESKYPSAPALVKAVRMFAEKGAAKSGS